MNTAGAVGAWLPAYIALGSNMQGPRAQILEACARLDTIPNTRLQLRSRLYATAPLGPQDQPFFINAVAGVLTQLPARELLNQLLALEIAMGRVRKQRWGPRLIDLDLLWMLGAVIDEPGLTLPHPGVSARNFVLYPLNDIAPYLEIPGLGRVEQLQARVGEDGISVLE